MLTNIMKLGTLVKNTAFWGGLASAAAYIWSASEEDPDNDPNKRKFKKLVDNNVIPALGNAASTMTNGVANIAEDLTKSDAAKKGIQSAATATETGLSALPGIATNTIPQAAGAVGGVVSSGVEVGQNTVGSFVDKLSFIPKDWKGWATTAAIVVGGLLGLKTGIAGDTLKALSGKLLDVPMNLITAGSGLALQVATPFLYIGAALTAGYFLLHPNGRQMISDGYNAVKNLASPKEGVAPTPEHSHAPAPAAAPAAIPAPMPNVSGLNLEGITGGISTNTVALNRDLPANTRMSASESHLATGA